MRVFILFSYLLTCISCMSQEKQVVYLFFDVEDNETIQINTEASEVKKNFRNKNAFFIEGQFFQIKNKSLIDKERLKEVTFSSIDYLIKKWDESNLISSINVFNKIYIVQKIKERYNLFEVIWNGDKSIYIRNN